MFFKVLVFLEMASKMRIAKLLMSPAHKTIANLFHHPPTLLTVLLPFSPGLIPYQDFVMRQLTATIPPIDTTYFVVIEVSGRSLGRAKIIS
jgi:hypothetical protein